MHAVNSFLTAFWLAVDSIRAHPLRSFLTLLGVIIGVSSVVLVGAAIDGLGLYAEETAAKAFGSDSYLVAQMASAGRLTRKERVEKLRYNKPIRSEDVEYLRLVTGDHILYSPYQQRFADVKYGDQTLEACTILGVAATLPEIRDVALIGGRFFTEQEERASQAVAVIGDEIRATFFPMTSPLGKQIKVQGLDFTVVGYQEKLGSAFGRSQDNQVYVPATMFARMYGRAASLAVFGKPRPETGLNLESGLDITRAALRSRFKARPGAPDNFDFLTPDSIRSFIGSILALVAAVVVPVTMISLVVGGIVIMNIMLVSVTERTREIGIRKAIGARRSDIMIQFLIEAVLLSSVGGAMGLALGAAVTSGLAAALEFKAKISITYVVLSLVVSSAVGIVSGWYPAARASKLDPVEALRAD